MDSANQRAVAIVGDINGYTGDAGVAFNGLSSQPWLAGNGAVNVVVQRIPEQAPLSAPQAVLNQTMTVSGGSITVPFTLHTGSAAVNGWTVKWTWPGNQQVTNAWNATVTQSGTAVSAANASYNATIAPGGTATFGFQGTYSGTNAAPSQFTLNGTTCAG